MLTVIIICLLVVIFLLISDKAGNMKRSIITTESDGNKPKLLSIMGKPKKVIVQSNKIQSPEVETKALEKISENIREKDPEEINAPVQISDDALDEIFTPSIDLEEEEEEWKRLGITVSDTTLAKGTTFEELSEAGRLLRSGDLQPDQKEAAVALVQKIHGTELFDLLENSVEGASKKIAELLDISFSENIASLSPFTNTNLTEFDINEFI
jgi:hypothetical protein